MKRVYISVSVPQGCKPSQCKSAVVGVYEPAEEGGNFILTPAALKIATETHGRLNKILKLAGKTLKKGDSRLLYNIHPIYSCVAVCCLGKRLQEDAVERKENIRAAVGDAIKQLQNYGEGTVEVDSCGDWEAAAEAAHLAVFDYNEFKDKKKRKSPVYLAAMKSALIRMSENRPDKIVLIRDEERHSDSKIVHEKGQLNEIEEGLRLNEIEEGLRLNEIEEGLRLNEIEEGQLNKMEEWWLNEIEEGQLNKIEAGPSSSEIKKGSYQASLREEPWIQSMRMGAFLSVAKGSAERPLFLEIDYKASDQDPIALVGKGITFDSGGISIKPSQNMDQMRGDMGGAACTVGAIYSIAKLKHRCHIKAFIPLCENMCSGTATKPGDVVTARNGKTIQVDNTDAEGRLILADALCYAETFNPKLIMDIATLTGAIDVALGSGATGVFTNSDRMWKIMQMAGGWTGDRVWRMPLFDHYRKQITESKLADVNNIGKYGKSGGACTAAAFLQEFVTNENWLHLDIAGVMSNKDEIPYLGKGMSGRPTRTVTTFIFLATRASEIRNLKRLFENKS